MPYDIFDDEKEDKEDWLDEKEDWEVWEFLNVM